MRRYVPGIIVGILVLGVIGIAVQSWSDGNSERSSAVADGYSSGSGSAGAATTTGGTSGGSASRSAAPVVGSSASTNSDRPSNSAPTGSLSSMVIRTAEVYLSVESVDGALDQVRRIAVDEDGSVFSSSTSTEGKSQIATLTIQVPSDRFDQVISSLRKMPGVGKVDRESVSSQDVTEEYLDLESRLRNLNATETRYLSLLQNATRLEDTLALERELTRVRGDIEQLTGRAKFLENRTQFSRITVTLRPTGAPSAADSSSFDFNRIVQEAWANSLDFTGTILSGVITTVVFLWWLWPIGLIGAFIAMRLRGQRVVRNSTPSV